MNMDSEKGDTFFVLERCSRGKTAKSILLIAIAIAIAIPCYSITPLLLFSLYIYILLCVRSFVVSFACAPKR